MADAKNAQPHEDDGALLAVEATEPVILQEPDRTINAGPEPDPDVAAVLQKPEARQSGLLGFVLGGALLAGAGFGVAKYVFPDTGSADAIAAVQVQLDANAAEGLALRSELASLAERPVADPALADRIAALEAAVSASPDTATLQASLGMLEERLAAIEAASVGGDAAPAAAIAVMDRELKSLRAMIEAQKDADPALVANLDAASAAAEERIAAAEGAVVTAAKQAALSHVRAAFQSGAPLGPALEGLRAMGTDIPTALTAAGESVPSLISLQDSFAEPARAALEASIRADMGEGWADRLSAFMRSQSGARSLTPREGSDPDAVLSRAEAALRDGQLETAVSELAALPPAGIEAMSDWVADAIRRLTAEQAIADLSATLNGQ